jgi:FlaG/FlaF family flagellin (archaellin)
MRVARHRFRSRRRLRSDRRAVSDVIANILILSMTVILFAIIFYYVVNLPVPPNRPRLAIQASLESDAGFSPGSTIYVNLSHLGGIALYVAATLITVSTPDGAALFTLADGGIDQLFEVGSTWRYSEPNAGGPIPLLNNATSVTVQILDTASNSVVWAGPVAPQSNLFGPQIIAGTSPTVVCALSNSYQIWARIVDPEGGDIVSVEFRSSALGYSLYTPMYYNFASDRWASTPGTILNSGRYSFEVRAEDEGGRVNSRTVFFTVAACPSGGGGGGNNTGGDNPVETGLDKRNSFQRYDIFNATEWDSKKWNATPTRDFRHGETVVAVVASKFLPNIEDKNSFTVWDPYAGIPLAKVVYGGGSPGPTTIPTSTKAFKWLEFNSGFYIYIYRFTTSSTPDPSHASDDIVPGSYPVEFEIKSTFVDPPNRFATNDWINVTDQNGSLPDYPQLMTYRSDCSTPATSFNFTETMCVWLQLMDTDSGVDIRDVTIEDYFGGRQIIGSPGSFPMTPVNVVDGRRYTFRVDLSEPNPDNWLAGINNYALRLRHVQDANELFEQILHMQIEVKGPRWYLDAATGMDKQTLINPPIDVAGLVYDNDDDWRMIPLAPVQLGKKQNFDAFAAIRFADYDLDRDLDVFAGAKDGRVAIWTNEDGLGHLWDLLMVDDTSPGGGRGKNNPVLAIDAGRLDNDLDPDVVIGTDDGEVWMYNNDGAWSVSFIDDGGASIQNVYVREMTGDGCNDIIASTDKGFSIFKNLKSGNDCTGRFGTSSFTYYEATNDLTGGHGVVNPAVNGYLRTQDTDNSYESITEVTAAATSWNTTDLAVWEQKGNKETVIGDFGLTQSQDGNSEVMTEQSDGTGANQRFRIDTTKKGGTTTCGSGTDEGSPINNVGHIYNMSVIPALSAGQSLRLGITARLSYASPPPAVENFWIGFSTDCKNPDFDHPAGSGSAMDQSKYWVINSESMTQYTYTLCCGAGSAGFTPDGVKQLYIHIIDSDGQKNPADKDTDQTTSTLNLDFLHIDVGSASTTSSLEHRWQFGSGGTPIAAGGTRYRFFTETFHNSSSEGDDMVYEWTTQTGGVCAASWSQLLVTKKQSDNNKYEPAALPDTLSGQICIRVVDGDSTDGNMFNHTVFVDHMYVERELVTPCQVVVNSDKKTWDLGIGDFDGDGDLDVAAGGDDKFLRIYENGGNTGACGMSWTLRTAIDEGDPVTSVGAGHMNSDGRVDVVVGLKGAKKVYARLNSGSIASWPATLAIDLAAAGDVLALEVGDINGDWLDDVLVGLGNGDTKWYKNEVTGFEGRIIDTSGTRKIWDVDLGDMDKGITRPYA